MPRRCFFFMLILVPFFCMAADPKQTVLNHQALLQADELEAAHQLWRNPNEQPWQVMMAFICAFYQDLSPTREQMKSQCDGQECIVEFDAILRNEPHQVLVYLSLYKQDYVIDKITAQPIQLSFMDSLLYYF